LGLASVDGVPLVKLDGIAEQSHGQFAAVQDAYHHYGPHITAAGVRLVGKAAAAAGVEIIGKNNTAKAIGQLGSTNAAAATEELGVTGVLKVGLAGLFDLAHVRQCLSHHDSSWWQSQSASPVTDKLMAKACVQKARCCRQASQ
jgi:hypothetical protein